MNTQLLSTIFREFSFYYPDSQPDFLDIRRKIIQNGGTIVNYPQLAAIKLAHTPCYERGDFYDVSLIDDSIQKGRMPDSGDYLIAPGFGYAWINSQRNYEARVSQETVDTMASQRTPPRYRSSEPVVSRGIQIFDETREYASRSRTRSPRKPTTISPEGLPRPFREVPITRYDDVVRMRGRVGYSHDDDMRIIDFVMKMQAPAHSANGQKLWDTAYTSNLIPGRTAQSMRGRWIKFIRPIFDERHPEYLAWAAQGKSWRDPYV
jgi:hypothetical protein